MHGRREHHIDYVNIGVIGNAFEIVVIVDILLGYIIFLFPIFGFRWRTGNNAG